MRPRPLPTAARSARPRSPGCTRTAHATSVSVDTENTTGPGGLGGYLERRRRDVERRAVGVELAAAAAVAVQRAAVVLAALAREQRRAAAARLAGAQLARARAARQRACAAVRARGGGAAGDHALAVLLMMQLYV